MMRRHWTLAALLAVLALIVAACGGGGTASTTSTTAGSGGETTTTAAESPGGSDLAPVGLIIAQGGLGDESYNDLAYSGLVRAGEATGLEVRPVEAADIVAEGEQVLRRAADAGFGLLIDLEFSHAEMLAQLAKEYPDTKFAFVNLPVEGDNIRSIVFKEHEGSFLAGMLAAMVTSDANNPKTNPEKIIGVIGGTKSAGIDKFIVGFIQGAKHVDPEVEVLVSYTNDFGDAAKGRDAAMAMFDQGADVVYQVAGGAGLGVLSAAAERGHYAIGVDSDQDGLQPGHVLTSMVKWVDRGVEQVVEEYAKGSFAGGTVLELGLAEDGVGLTDFKHTKAEIPQEFLDRIEEARRAIISGEITVWDVVADGYPDFFPES
jgi:basic membrane protein A